MLDPSHFEVCEQCGGQAERALLQQALEQLAAEPTHASAARSWSLVRAAIVAERSERASAPWFGQLVALAAAGLLLTWLGHSYAVASAWHPWLLPTVVVGFGVAASLAAFPLLSSAARSTSTRLVPCSK
jgi:apolipoprotein N-acyltransferase